MSACLFAVPFAESEQRWGKDGNGPDPALQYLIDRKLLDVSEGNRPVVAAFRNYFNDSEIFSTIRMTEDKNGRSHVWENPFSSPVLREQNGLLVTPTPYRVFKLAERAHELLDAETTPATPTINGNDPPKPAGGRPSISESEARKREGLVEQWNRAKAAGVRQKDFCGDKAVPLKYLTTSINWLAQRRRRSSEP